MKNNKRSDVNTNTREKVMTASVEDLWEYGWTHFGKVGQTRARMNKETREVEIKERNGWLKCCSGCDILFTSTRLSANAPSFFH